MAKYSFYMQAIEETFGHVYTVCLVNLIKQ